MAAATLPVCACSRPGEMCVHVWLHSDFNSRTMPRPRPGMCGYILSSLQEPCRGQGRACVATFYLQSKNHAEAKAGHVWLNSSFPSRTMPRPSNQPLRVMLFLLPLLHVAASVRSSSGDAGGNRPCHRCVHTYASMANIAWQQSGVFGRG